jgi:hypothetical protein
MSVVRDPLEYALNRMENAARQQNPAAHGYGSARKELLDGIVSLRDANAVLSDHVADLAPLEDEVKTLRRDREDLCGALDRVKALLKAEQEARVKADTALRSARDTLYRLGSGEGFVWAGCLDHTDERVKELVARMQFASEAYQRIFVGAPGKAV